ncbi:MAG: glycosyltransferase family 4 protein [Terriglobales bacterium]
MKTVASMPQTVASASPRGALKVLVLDEALPYPPDSGKRLRTWNLLRHLAPRHQITLLAHGEHDSARELAARRALEAAGLRVRTVAPLPDRRGLALYAALLRNCASPWPYSVAKHHTPRYTQAVREELRDHNYDLVQVEWTPYSSHLLRSRVLRSRGPIAPPPTLIASHNIEAQIWERRAQLAHGAARLYFRAQASKMRRFEAEAFARAQFVTGVSQLDAEAAGRLGAPRVAVVANGVDLDYFQPRSHVESEMIAFVGALDWFPNQDAVEFFAAQVLPLVRAVAPTARFRVVGRRPPAAWASRAWPGVELVGEVSDVRPEMERAGVMVAPLRVGGGSRIKILEALAMEKPVVATTIGAEGLELLPREHLQVADSAEALAASVLECLRNRPAARAMGCRGAALVRGQYGWEQSALALERAWAATVKQVAA